MSATPAPDVLPMLVEVKDNLDREASLASLAREYGCSPFQFHRLFSRAVGETPKQHVQRLRLERAAYKLAITDDSIVDVGLSVGFCSHETFTRAFRRRFGMTPSAWRLAAKAAQVERMQRNRDFRGEGCSLSGVWFAQVPPTPALAIRRLGAYAGLGPAERAGLWEELARWAARHGAACQDLRLGLFPDNPTLTPPDQQGADLCIPIERAVAGDERVRCIALAGGLYAMIEHLGPGSTMSQAYSNLADGVRRSRYEFREDPPIQVFLEEPTGEAGAGQAQVWFPVRRRAARKKDQEGSGGAD
jgi:AraC family transcriptional regulator